MGGRMPSNRACHPASKRKAARLAPARAASHIRGMHGAVLQDILVNGEPRGILPGSTVAGMLAQLGLDRRKVAVERNEEIVSRSAYDTAMLGAGDRIEIVHFIGGG